MAAQASASSAQNTARPTAAPGDAGKPFAITFLSAFGLVYLSKKYTPKYVHLICLVIAGIGLLLYPQMNDPNMLILPVTAFGIAWASMMGVPYLMVVHDIPKERYGVYMGIINMMIVVPMIIQTTTFGYILKNFLGNDPRNAISFAGVLLLIAAVATIFCQLTTSIPIQILTTEAISGCK